MELHPPTVDDDTVMPPITATYDEAACRLGFLDAAVRDVVGPGTCKAARQ